jgi:hypothetical protein
VDHKTPHIARRILEVQGLRPTDVYDLPDSPIRFADGGHYRLEISGVERLSTFEALLDEGDRRGVFVHRVIAFVAGATLIDDSELRAFAQLAREQGVEAIVVPGPRGAWDHGRQAVTPEGKTTGGRIRGSDNFYFMLRDYLRCIELGFRGLLVWDEGMLDTLVQAREGGDLPADTVFKVSVFTGHGNAASIRLLERIGADSVNPVGDLTRPMIASIRRSVKIPLDLYAFVYESFGGMNRFWEAADLTRVAAPCYFKIEPGESEAALYSGWTDPGFHEFHVREKVRYAQILSQLIDEESAGVLVPSPPEGAKAGVPASTGARADVSAASPA